MHTKHRNPKNQPVGSFLILATSRVFFARGPCSTSFQRRAALVLSHFPLVRWDRGWFEMQDAGVGITTYGKFARRCRWLIYTPW
jgi:hypothetical protein